MFNFVQKIVKLSSVLTFFAAIFYFLFMSFKYMTSYGSDVLIDVIAASNALLHLPIYQSLSDPYIYPPASLWIFMPLTFFAPSIGARLWFSFNFFCLVGIFIIIHKLFCKTIPFWIELGIFTLILYSYSTHTTLRIGQVNLVIPFLTTLAYYFFTLPKTKIQNQILTGICIGLAANLKITAGLLVLYLILKRSWTSIISLLTTVFLSNLVTIAILNIKPSDILSFLNNIFGLSLASSAFNIAIADTQLNQSVSRFFYTFTSNLRLANILSILTFLILTALILRSKKLSDWVIFNFFLISSVFFFGVYSWEHYLIFFIPLLASALNLRWHFLYVFIFASFYFNPYEQLLFFGKIFDLDNPALLFIRFHAIVIFMLLFYVLTKPHHAKST